jgi:hypothetical protein
MPPCYPTSFKHLGTAGVELSGGRFNPILSRRLTAMIACTLLMAGVLGTADVSRFVQGLRHDKPREEFVINITWQLIEKWQVEIREYQFHRGAPRQLPPRPWKIERRGYQEHRGLPPIIAPAQTWKIELVESEYRDDLRAVFEQLKKQIKKE